MIDDKQKKLLHDYDQFGQVFVLDIGDILNDTDFNEELEASAALICLNAEH